MTKSDLKIEAIVLHTEEKNAIRERDVENIILDSKKEQLPSTSDEVKNLIPILEGFKLFD
ncbi:MAG: hypothetical protein IKT00_05340 [Prevotella sp.]|nr:hypothetical protein [Prevotella sp.]